VGNDEGSLNAFEDELLRQQLRRLTGRDVPVTYEKVFSDADADDLVNRVRAGCAATRWWRWCSISSTC